MECNYYEEQMSLWIDDQLTHNEVRDIEAHIATCLTCRTSLEALKRLDRLLSAAPVVSPATGFSNRFQARLATRHRRRRTWAGILTLTLATLVLLLGAVTVLTVSGLALWGNLPTNILLPQATSLLLDLGKAVAASLNLVWLIVRSLARGLQHPAFIAFVAATAVLITVWAQIVARRVLVSRPVSAN